MDLLSTRGRENTRDIEDERPRPDYSENQLGNNLIARIFSKKDRGEDNNQLSEIVDIDKDLQTFKQNQLKLLNPKVLYNSTYFSRNDALHRHYREKKICIRR